MFANRQNDLQTEDVYLQISKILKNVIMRITNKHKRDIRIVLIIKQLINRQVYGDIPIGAGNIPIFY